METDKQTTGLNDGPGGDSYAPETPLIRDHAESTGKTHAVKHALRSSVSRVATTRPARIVRRHPIIVSLVLLIVIALVAWLGYTSYINSRWDTATAYFNRGDYANTAKELKGLGVPSDQKRLNVYAQTMLATRQFDKALPAYTKLYEAKKDPSTQLIIGNIYNEQKRYDDAAKTYKSLIAANGGFIQAYVNLATLDRLQGKTDDAIAVAKSGVKANPNSAVLYELLISMLLDRKDSADYKQAVDALTKLNPQDPILKAIKQ